MRWFHPVLWVALITVCSLLFAEMNAENYLRAADVAHFFDTENKESIATVTQKTFIDSEKKAIPARTKTVWIKIAVPQVLQSWSQNAVLFTGSNETALSIEAYSVSDQGIEELGICDYRLESTSCKVPSLQYSFAVNKNGAQNRFYYLKVVPGASGISNEFYFMKQSYFKRAIIFLESFIGLSLGIYLFAAIVSLIFYTAFKERGLVVFSLLYLSIFASTTINRGLWDTYRPEEIVFTGSTLQLPVLILTLFFDLLFIRVFFALQKHHPRLNSIYNFFLAAAAAITLICFLPETKLFALKTIIPFMFGCMGLNLVTLIYFMRLKRPWAEQIATAWGVSIVCILIWLLFRKNSVLEFWFFGYYATFGRTLQALILNTLLLHKLHNLILKVGSAQAEGKESNVVKTLLRTLSHDLSNTTQLVKATAQVLKQSTEDAKLLKNIDSILYAAQEQAEIIENAKNGFLLRGKSVLNLSPVDLISAISETVDMFQPEIKKKNLSVSVKSPEKAIRVLAEKTSLIHQVISNLISNACKYSPEGKLIEITAIKADAATVILKIKDEGAGIEPQLLDHIFDEQVDVRRVGTQGELGTGNGLLIVRDFMAAYGGTLAINSKVGQGVEVTLRFQRFE